MTVTAELHDIDEGTKTDSPDPSPIKKPRVESFVLVKEYRSTKQNGVEKNYVQKNISTHTPETSALTKTIKSSSSLESLDFSFGEAYNQIKTFKLPPPQCQDYQSKNNTFMEKSVAVVVEEENWWERAIIKASKTVAVGLLLAGGTLGLYHIAKERN